MIRPMTTFDPSDTMQGMTFINNIQGYIGYLLIYNDSMITISISYQGYNRTVPAGMFLWLKIATEVDTFTWAQEQIFPNVGQAPSSAVIIEGADISEKEYVERLASPVALPRITNVGNSVPINTSSSSVVNDGNPPGTNVVEATPAAAGSSQLLLKNDGTGVLGNGNLLIGATVLSVQGGYTIAAPAIGAGFLGVTTEIGTSTLNKISMQNLGGGPEVGIISTGSAVWLSSGTNIGFLYNAYFDSANYRFHATGDLAAQLLLSKDALGGTVPRFQIRYSSTPGTAGAVITWNQFQLLPEMINNGGTGGTHIFTGTTTPTGAVAGDLWFNG
jgi:hypothetical protein